MKNYVTLMGLNGFFTVASNNRYRCKSLEMPVCMESLETLSANKAAKINEERLL